MQQTQISKSTASRWPYNATVPLPREDSFPIRNFLIWFLVGLGGFVVLLMIFFYLDNRASKAIVYIDRENTLSAVRADGTASDPLNSLRHFNVISPPQWSPRGGRFVSIVGSATAPSSTLLIASRSGEIISRIPLDYQRSSLAAQAWSPSGSYVSVIVEEGMGSNRLQIVDVNQNRTIALDQTTTIDGFSVTWHPKQDELLASTIGPEGQRQLGLVNVTGSIQIFEPVDEYIERMQGAWSPDGERIVYIATNPYDPYQSVIVANRDGSEPVILASDELHMLPVWAPRGDFIIFTRYMRETNDPVLYRIQPNGEGLTQIGLGFYYSNTTQDESIIAWSPDQRRMLFQSFDRATGKTIISVASYDGTDPRVIVEEANDMMPLKVVWSPTNRGFLIADVRRSIRLYWLDRSDPDVFPQGSHPSWEP